MAEGPTINYLFPPDQIEQLPTWRFVLHFELPFWFRKRKIKKAGEALKAITEWKAIRFVGDLDNLPINDKGTVDIAIEVTEDDPCRVGGRDQEALGLRLSQYSGDGRALASKGIREQNGMDEVFDVCHVLMSKGAFCDCEVLCNVYEGSRLAARYWKQRAQEFQEPNP